MRAKTIETTSMQAHVGLHFGAFDFCKSFARGLFDRNVVFNASVELFSEILSERLETKVHVYGDLLVKR